MHSIAAIIWQNGYQFVAMIEVLRRTIFVALAPLMIIFEDD